MNLLGDGAGRVVRHNQTHTDHDKCLISLRHQREHHLSCYILKEFVFLQVLHGQHRAPCTGLAARCPRYKVVCNPAFSRGEKGSSSEPAPALPRDWTFPGAAHAGPTPAKHLSTCLTFNTSITHGEVKPREAAGAEIAVKRKWGGGDLIASLSQWTCLQTSFRAWGKMIVEANRSMTCYSVVSPAPTFARERGREWGRSVQFVRCYHT